MKKLLIALLFLVSINTSSQFFGRETIRITETTSVRVKDSYLVDMTREYFAEAKRRGLDMSRFNTLVSIEFVTVEEMDEICKCNPWGLTKYDRERVFTIKESRIYISINALDFGLDNPEEFVKMILWHELWHVYSPMSRHFNSPLVPRIFNSGITPNCDFRFYPSEMNSYFYYIDRMPRYIGYPTY